MKIITTLQKAESRILVMLSLMNVQPVSLLAHPHGQYTPPVLAVSQFFSKTPEL